MRDLTFMIHSNHLAVVVERIDFVFKGHEQIAWIGRFGRHLRQQQAASLRSLVQLLPLCQRIKFALSVPDAQHVARGQLHFALALVAGARRHDIAGGFELECDAISRRHTNCAIAIRSRGEGRLLAAFLLEGSQLRSWYSTRFSSFLWISPNLDQRLALDQEIQQPLPTLKSPLHRERLAALTGKQRRKPLPLDFFAEE